MITSAGTVERRETPLRASAQADDGIAVTPPGGHGRYPQDRENTHTPSPRYRRNSVGPGRDAIPRIEIILMPINAARVVALSRVPAATLSTLSSA
jgi:hypothetical protein